MKTFWRWFDRCARLDFAGNALAYVFDWRGWIAATVGGGGGAMTFLWAAIDGRSPLEVWVFAAVVVAALAMFVYFSIGALQRLKIHRQEASAVAQPLVERGPYCNLRELFGRLGPHLTLTATKRNGHTSIGTHNRGWEAIGNEVLKQLSSDRLHAIGVGYRNITERLNPAPIPVGFWLTAKFTYWFWDDDGDGIMDAKNADGTEYSNIEVNRAEALAIWPHSLTQAESEMISLFEAATRAYEAAEEAGILKLTTSTTASPEANLNHFKLLFMVDDETEVFGVKPPSTKARLIPKADLQGHDLYPATGENSQINHLIPADRIAYTNVTVRRKDLQRVIDGYIAEAKRYGG